MKDNKANAVPPIPKAPIKEHKPTLIFKAKINETKEDEDKEKNKGRYSIIIGRK